MEIEIAGDTPGLEFDYVNALGQPVTLDGTLELSTLNGFVPPTGSTYEIITAAEIVGTFADVIGADLGDGVLFDVLYLGYWVRPYHGHAPYRAWMTTFLACVPDES